MGRCSLLFLSSKFSFVRGFVRFASMVFIANEDAGKVCCLQSKMNYISLLKRFLE